jgi:peptide deformylase
MNIVKKRSELTTPCEIVDDLDEGNKIADQLLEVLETHPGIGLSANQIGIQKRVCVISVPDKDGVQWNRRFINPETVWLKDPFIFTQEGCLSFPNEYIHTLRYHEICIKCSLYPDGLELSGLEAVVSQHECDHINGIVMHMRRHKAISPNNKCPCNSGKKFKKCCMINLKSRDLF